MPPKAKSKAKSTKKKPTETTSKVRTYLVLICFPFKEFFILFLTYLFYQFFFFVLIERATKSENVQCK